MTLLQLVLFIYWMLCATTLFVENLYINFFLMAIVGLMGGASYVNVIYNV